MKFGFEFTDCTHLGSRGNCLLARTEDAILLRMFRLRNPEFFLYLSGPRTLGAISDHHSVEAGTNRHAGCRRKALNGNDTHRTFAHVRDRQKPHVSADCVTFLRCRKR